MAEQKPVGDRAGPPSPPPLPPSLVPLLYGSVALGGACLGLIAVVAQDHVRWEIGSVFYAAGFVALVYGLGYRPGAVKLMVLVLIVWAIEAVNFQMAVLTFYSIYPGRVIATLGEWLVVAAMRGWLTDRVMIAVAAATGAGQAALYLLLLPWLIAETIANIGGGGPREAVSLTAAVLYGSTALMLAYGFKRGLLIESKAAVTSP